jgi:hypothetical protein
MESAKDDVSKYIGLFTELNTPVNGCIVLLGKRHIGVFYDGMIFHNDRMGVRAETQRALKYKYNGFKYYKVKK